jgi:hypothetical protein
MLQILTGVVPSSNLSWDAAYPEVFQNLHQFLYANASRVHRLGHDHFLPNPFCIIIIHHTDAAKLLSTNVSLSTFLSNEQPHY